MILKSYREFKLNIANKIFPVKISGFISLDSLDLKLNYRKALTIEIEKIPLIEVTANLCLESSEMTEFTYYFNEPLTILVESDFPLLELKEIPVILNEVKIAGKVYGQELLDLEEGKGQDKCIHGLRKDLCSECLKKEKKEKKEVERQIDIFDLILPILQPPPGELFDNPIVLPKDKRLYPFQNAGIKFLLENDYALLGDEMGLGKSIQTIMAIKCLFHMGKIFNTLIVCPKAVFSDWEKKLQEWAPELKVTKIYGPKEQRAIEWKTRSHIYLVTYDTLRQDLLENPYSNLIGLRNDDKLDIKRRFDLIVLDEIQRIKNPNTGIHKAVKKIEASRRWGLSGTPLENRPEELVAIFSYLKPGLLHYNDAKNLQKVKETIRPYFLRRLKKDVLKELPEKEYDEVWLELLPEQRETYDKAEKTGIIELNEKGDRVTVQHILALITKLKEICNLDPVTKKSSKLEYLKEKLSEICEEGDKVIIFSQYPEKTLRDLLEQLKDFNPLLYDGSLSNSERNRIINKFQEEDENKVILMSVKAGGVGITLTRANYVYHFDLWWNPAIALQAEDRAHRIGQKKTVFVTYLYTVDTIEERIHNLINKKKRLFVSYIDDLSERDLSKTLTEEELFSLFNLKVPRRK